MPLYMVARVDARAEGQRPGAGRLERLVGVRHRVLELVDDAEAALRHVDLAGRHVARLLVVAPGAVLALDRDRLDVLDDRVVRVDVAVQAAHLAVGDDVEPGLVHVADRGVGGVVEHLVQVAVAPVAGLVRADAANHQLGLPCEPTTVEGINGRAAICLSSWATRCSVRSRAGPGPRKASYLRTGLVNGDRSWRPLRPSRRLPASWPDLAAPRPAAPRR